MATSYFCAVKDCSNGSRTLEKWKCDFCNLHGTFHRDSACSCEPPFKLFPFPTTKKDLNNRSKWIRLINRCRGKGKPWIPNNHSRVCSFHFVGGAPSSVNPFSTLNLGYDATTRIRIFSEQSTRNENRVTAESPIMEGISTPLKKNLPILLGGKSLITIKKKGKGVLKEESPLSSRKIFSPNIIKMKLATKLFPTINNDRNVQENNTSNKEINQLTTITHHSKEIKKTNQTNRNPIITTKENDSPININKNQSYNYTNNQSKTLDFPDILIFIISILAIYTYYS